MALQNFLSDSFFSVTETPPDSTPTNAKCFVGCPVWACDGWVGSLYSSSKRRTWLSEYSEVFSTVEGNSTFYAMPTIATVKRWADETRPGFRFALKFPRVISHDCRLQHAQEETRLFIEALEVLQQCDRLGPSFLQLPPSFSGKQFTVLESYLRQLPRELPFAVEVRHLDFFQHSPHDDRLNELLFELGMDRVIFDSRALYSNAPSDEYEEASQSRKPDLPVRPVAIGNRPLVRFVGRNSVDETQPWIEEWTPVIAEWIDRGKTPYVFTHSPDDLYAPQFAARFIRELRNLSPQVAALPERWPGQNIRRQQKLF